MLLVLLYWQIKNFPCMRGQDGDIQSYTEMMGDWMEKGIQLIGTGWGWKKYVGDGVGMENICREWGMEQISVSVSLSMYVLNARINHTNIQEYTNIQREFKYSVGHSQCPLNSGRIQ